ncbi:glycosyltransferase [Brachyspira catarrhinii]|uniref:Glycosyltransferase n=1 Tax=Brachyspira catarrhinii TaxID=2528966 RepID=A0ABY2TRE1_9SPIR|nr:glycosyltransferase [Brachyspira catarrhinii]TKZ35380.1 glycosyltransferase [Brachyspira catarrhinii]
MIKLFEKCETEKYIVIKILFIKITFKKKSPKSDIDAIVWWIPFKSLRNAVRNLLNNYTNLLNMNAVNLENINFNNINHSNEIIQRLNEIKIELNKLDIRNKARMQLLSMGDERIIKPVRNEKLIISLTTYPQRIGDIDVVIFSLINQSVKTDKIILWLAYEEFPNLEKDIPNHILNLKKFGLEIEFCHNIYSYKKLIYALEKYPNDLIVTADDDIYYPYNWLEKLYKSYLENPTVIHCHRGHRIRFDDKNNILPYSQWLQEFKPENNNPSYLNFSTGGAGTLYQYKLLHSDIFNEELFLKLCPKADDVWFWAMALLNNTKINIIESNMTPIVDYELGYNYYSKLVDINVIKNFNDIQLDNCFKYYGDKLKDKLFDE